MTPRLPANIPASIRERLLNLAKSSDQDFNYLLSEFATERFLYRLGVSAYNDRFVLKGARLMMIWSERSFRTTRDLDLLGFIDASPESVEEAVKAICGILVESDGLDFDESSIQVTEIRHQQKYKGQRIKLNAYLNKARILLQIDVGFGDVVTPSAVNARYSTLLKDLPVPQIRIYTRETVVAEKLHAMVLLGSRNTRLKDFFDIATLAREFQFQGLVLVTAIRATFERRDTVVPSELPISLFDEFAESAGARSQWKSFLERSDIAESPLSDLSEVQSIIRAFLSEPVDAARNGLMFDMVWHGDKGWHNSP